jgi:amidophosphoribosyltransferase
MNAHPPGRRRTMPGPESARSTNTRSAADTRGPSRRPTAVAAPPFPASVKTAMACSRATGPELEDRDGPRDECGVFGIFAPGHEVSRLSYFALYALQHRGQESAGIAAADRGGHIITRRELGLVNQVFTENDLSTLAGELAIGHVRYSTTGSNAWENSQPVQRSVGTRGSQREVALAHNGNLINAVELHNELLAKGVTFSSTSDSEIIAALIATHPAERVEDAIAEVLPRLKGAFSTVVMTKDRVVAFRDPHGLRPLALGVLEPAGAATLKPPAEDPDGQVSEAAGGSEDDTVRYCVASESCAFDIIGAKFLRDVEPGEVVTLSEEGCSSIQVVEGARKAFCVFEYIYFARPDSRMNDQVLQVARGRMGEILWHEAPVEADLVIAVPDSGNPAARGLARAAGLPQDDGFVKNRYVARTFIQPGQELRKHGLRLKFNPLPEVIAGKRLVVVDDSIVRGNTTRQIVQMLCDSGAAEVHLRISAPPIKHPCHYGIDMSTREEMIAHGRTTAEVAAELGCDSLHYLSMEGVYEAVRGTRATHCDACFTGEYPLAGSDDANGKYALEDQEPTGLSLPLVRA